LIRRREFTKGLISLPVAIATGALTVTPRGAHAASKLPADALRQLDSSPYVYVSPLLSSGKESTCHAEVWFAWLDGSVVMTVGSSGWKARSLAKGLSKARIWVGDHGRWKGLVGKNEEFRKGPTFDAKAEKVTERAVVDRLLARYDEKYPDEIGRWRDKMSQGFEDGSRTVIRYTPVR